MERPGEVPVYDLERAMAQLRQFFDTPRGHRWFGELVTEPRYACEPDPREVKSALAKLRRLEGKIELSPDAKLAWQQGADTVTVFANGESFTSAASTLPILMLLCSGEYLDAARLDRAWSDPDTAAMLESLLRCGCIHVRE